MTLLLLTKLVSRIHVTFYSTRTNLIPENQHNDLQVCHLKNCSAHLQSNTLLLLITSHNSIDFLEEAASTCPWVLWEWSLSEVACRTVQFQLEIKKAGTPPSQGNHPSNFHGLWFPIITCWTVVRELLVGCCLADTDEDAWPGRALHDSTVTVTVRDYTTPPLLGPTDLGIEYYSWRRLETSAIFTKSHFLPPSTSRASRRKERVTIWCEEKRPKWRPGNCPSFLSRFSLLDGKRVYSTVFMTWKYFISIQYLSYHSKLNSTTINLTPSMSTFRGDLIK